MSYKVNAGVAKHFAQLNRQLGKDDKATNKQVKANKSK